MAITNGASLSELGGMQYVWVVHRYQGHYQRPVSERFSSIMVCSERKIQM